MDTWRSRRWLTGSRAGEQAPPPRDFAAITRTSHRTDPCPAAPGARTNDAGFTAAPRRQGTNCSSDRGRNCLMSRCNI